ncbi:lipoate--protein ligase family protein [Synechococcus sp. MIT S9504]|uniref:lipoate--protein ligase family protein n=1 Tax=Synechococcus sp. MIT S9504 TaxID=1801628 RepID=UPI0007BAFBE7|nr:lipoate--protein ligase family protein [Synechococcus sp. MIT S9504]KZR86852.1 Octanoyltransferase LipM [Synechococcus sp. MIT S9504]
MVIAAMMLPASCSSEPSRHGRLVPNLTLNGAEQMALDALLLEQCWTKGQNQPILRFYNWKRPSLSLGRHQRDIPDPWLNLARTGQLDLLRRPSGGGAVLHAGGLTYALVWPEAPRQKREAYLQVNRWITAGFAQLGVSLHPGDSPAEAGAINCFARSTTADLVDGHGTKRIGSAQYWQHGHLLQHGEIPLTPPADLWQVVFGNDPPRWTPASPDASAVQSALISSFSKGLSTHDWTDQPLSPEERSLMQQGGERYRLGVSAL